MAIVLISLLAGLFSDFTVLYKIAVISLVINMTFPKLFYPFAFLWMGLSGFLGSYISKLILIVIYLLIVVPVGYLRRLWGKDALLLSEFKKGTGSVMKTRNHKFSAEDLEHPY